MLNLDGIRQLIPTLPVLNAHALSLAEGYFVAALVVQLRGLDVRVSGHAPGDVDVTAAFKIVHDANGLKELVSYRSREMAEKVARKVLSREHTSRAMLISIRGSAAHEPPGGPPLSYARIASWCQGPSAP